MRFSLAFLAAFAALLLLHQLWFGRYWYEHGPVYRPVYGANFSCRHAAWLGLDCRETLTAVLDDLGVRHLRLSVYWDEVEPQDDRFDFSSIDWQIQEAARRDARIVLTVGMKAQRYPEFYLPAWLQERAALPDRSHPLCPFSPAWDPLVLEETLEMLQTVVARYAGEPAIEAWQVENEPLLRNWNKTRGWWIPPDVLALEVAAVRAADPLGRPVVITDSTWYRFEDRWRQALAAGDVLGQAVYTKKHHYGPAWFYLRPYRLGPLTPDLPAQAAAARAQGKELWLTELQAEPDEAQETVTRLRPEEIASITPRLLRRNVDLANHSGAGRVYLWGVEWWLYMKERWNEPKYWEAGREIFQEQATVAAEPLPAAPSGDGAIPPRPQPPPCARLYGY